MDPAQLYDSPSRTVTPASIHGMFGDTLALELLRHSTS